MVALLNDLFGIQARGGCSCAGPYGHRLLGIDLDASHAFEREIARGCEGIKPGWVRVNFNYFISEAVFEFILDAVDLVARDGWRLLPQYRFDADDRPVAPPRRRRSSRRSRCATSATTTGGCATPRTAIASRRIALWPTTSTRRGAPGRAPPPRRPDAAGALEVGADFEALRWFWLPGEVAAQLVN